MQPRYLEGTIRKHKFVEGLTDDEVGNLIEYRNAARDRLRVRASNFWRLYVKSKSQ